MSELKKMYKKYRIKGDLKRLQEDTGYCYAMIRKVIDGERQNAFIENKIKARMKLNETKSKIINQ